MIRNLYITGAESGSGKSVIVLAMMEYFSGHTGQTGFFRPVTRSGEQRDQLIHLVTQRYQIASAYEDLYGCSSDVARRLIAEDRYDELLKRILEKYRRLQAQYDRVLCVGTDYSGAYAALEFDFNTDVANNLGCLIMPVVRGSGRSNTEIQDAAAGFLKSLQERHCDILATVINSVARPQLDELKSRFEHARLGTLDAVVFTGGIGENAARVREQCCAGMEALGITLDREKNASSDSKSFDIHGEASPVSLLVIPTNEELEIAQQAVSCIQATG